MHIVLVQSHEIREADFIKDMLAELQVARRKFPTQEKLTTFTALVEEVGELAEALLMVGGQANTKNKTPIDVWHEAVQVATMAIRCIMDTGVLDGYPEKMADFFDREFGGLIEDDVSEMFEKSNLDPIEQFQNLDWKDARDQARNEKD